jgi:HSP20 family protein
MLALWNQFDDLFHDDANNRGRRLQRSFVPAVDIEETRDGYLLTADLPGLKSDDVSITVENGVLTVAGERKAAYEETKDGYRRIERSYGKFRRTFTLPKGVDVNAVSAVTEHGQLKVRIPKPVAEIPRKIEVKSAAPA